MNATKNQITQIYQETIRLQLHLIQALENTENDDTHHTDDHLAAAEGHIESISANFDNLTLNHTH